MKGLRGKLLPFTLMLCLCIHSLRAQECSAVSRDIMDILQEIYRDRGEDYFAALLMKESPGISPDEEEEIRDDIRGFFASPAFYSTGCRYLDGLFSQNELYHLQEEVSSQTPYSYDSLKNTVSLAKMLEKLEPLLYNYLKKKVLR